MAAILDTILDDIAELSVENQEMVDEIIHKRVIDAKRDEILSDYHNALEELQSGTIQTGSVANLFDKL